MPSNWIFWLVFNLFVLAMLALDLGLFHREKHVVKLREAISWTVVWITLAGLLRGAHLLFRAHHGWARGVELPAFAGVRHRLPDRLSLSVDNLFVFLLIFRYFRVPQTLQHEVLFWGVLGALVMRAVFIAAGVALLNRFHWVIYVFGAILIYSGLELMRQKGKAINPEANLVLRGFRKLFRVTKDYEGDKFFVRRGLVRYATPLAVVLVMVETTDLLFATDSIPAVLAVTREPFIVYTSNVFAILGLRSLYFALAGMIEMFHFLHYGLSLILIFIGVKMLASSHFEIPIGVALGVVAGMLAASVGLSMIFPERKK